MVIGLINELHDGYAVQLVLAEPPFSSITTDRSIGHRSRNCRSISEFGVGVRKWSDVQQPIQTILNTMLSGFIV